MLIIQFEFQVSAAEQLVVRDAVAGERLAAQRHAADVARIGYRSVGLDDQFAACGVDLHPVENGGRQRVEGFAGQSG